MVVVCACGEFRRGPGMPVTCIQVGRRFSVAAQFPVNQKAIKSHTDRRRMLSRLLRHQTIGHAMVVVYATRVRMTATLIEHLHHHRILALGILRPEDGHSVNGNADRPPRRNRRRCARTLRMQRYSEMKMLPFRTVWIYVASGMVGKPVAFNDQPVILGMRAHVFGWTE